MTGLQHDILTFGNNEDGEYAMDILVQIIGIINRANLTPLAANVILSTLGAMATKMIDTPEKELEVCLGIKSNG